ncbi:MAG: hypothetical protein Tsb002_27180 [Wenzhouxiangellaceae bacterium]
MGTSGSSSGSGSNTPLVPSWLENGDDGPLPCSNDGDAPEGDEQNQLDTEPKVKPPLPLPAPSERFRGARTNFSRFAGSGGNDTRALRRAIRDYVRSGTGGSRTAVKRMGTSRTAASNALGVFRSIRRDGVRNTLRRLNLEELAGRSVQDVFLGLTEVICEDGGSIDEATARDAWLETIAELDQFGIDDLDNLSPEQVSEMFLSFISNSIETRLYQEIGVNGFKYADSLGGIDGFNSQLSDYIARGVRDSFQHDLSVLSNMTDQKIRDIVDSTYKDAWDLLQAWGDAEE